MSLMMTRRQSTERQVCLHNTPLTKLTLPDTGFLFFSFLCCSLLSLSFLFFSCEFDFALDFAILSNSWNVSWSCKKPQNKHVNWRFSAACKCAPSEATTTLAQGNLFNCTQSKLFPGFFSGGGGDSARG